MPVHGEEYWVLVVSSVSIYGREQQAILTLGFREAINHSISVLCDPGDNILVPGPGLPYYAMSAAGVEVETRQYHLKVPGSVPYDAVLVCACVRTHACVRACVCLCVCNCVCVCIMTSLSSF